MVHDWLAAVGVGWCWLPTATYILRYAVVRLIIVNTTVEEHALPVWKVADFVNFLNPIFSF